MLPKLKVINKVFDGKPQRLDNVSAGSSKKIRRVLVLNNTPFFLYVAREETATRENALFVVEPYADVMMPVNVAQALYVLEGPSIGVIPAGCQAAIFWDDQDAELNTRKTGRNVVIPVYRGKAAGAVTTNLTAQNTGGQSGTVAPQPVAGVFAVPASATRRSIYGVMISGAAKFSAATLEGSIDGSAWFPLAALTVGTQVNFQYDVPGTRALPPFLRVSFTQDVYDGSTSAVYMVVDL